jgi:hypothetical protein
MILMIKKSICRLLLSIFSLALLSPLAFAQQGAAAATKTAALLSDAEQKAAALLKVETIREVTVALSAPEMLGRGVAQLGGDRAARYIADRFARLGLKPQGGPRTYQQPIRFRTNEVLPESSLKIGDSVFKFKSDFIFDRTASVTEKVTSGGLVFAGYGVVSEELKRDDLANLDVKGKLVILLTGKPENIEAAVWNKAVRSRDVFERLVQKGAAGVIQIIANYELTAAYASRRQIRLADAPQMTGHVIPVAMIGHNTAAKILATTGKTYAQIRQQAEAGELVSRDLNVQASLSSRVNAEEGTSSNVIGYIEGSDPILKNELLLYTAHYDAYGKDADGTIYPGAGDNALGVAKLIALAETFAQMKVKPRRSIMFIALTGEEYGLLGAEYWVKHPTWPLGSVAANINYDGIGTDAWGKLGVLIDYGFTHSDLGDVIRQVASASNIFIIPDPQPQERVFYRSDHYVFFKRGIPALYLLGLPENVQIAQVAKWMATSYHMTSDTVQPNWNWEGARTLAALGLITGMRIANQETMPAWKSESPYNRPRGTLLPPPR